MNKILSGTLLCLLFLSACDKGTVPAPGPETSNASPTVPTTTPPQTASPASATEPVPPAGQQPEAGPGGPPEEVAAATPPAEEQAADKPRAAASASSPGPTKPAVTNIPVATEPAPTTTPTPTGATTSGGTQTTPTMPGEEAMALAKQSGCLACHDIGKKVVGPAWMDVSKRYIGDSDAKARLIEKVHKGGKGNWTEVTNGAPMPPYSPRVSDENIEKLVTFVLSLAG